jgi:hypothetical protein
MRAEDADGMVAALVRTIFAQTDAEATRGPLRQVVASLEPYFPSSAAILTEAEHDVTAYAAFPRAHWGKIWFTNPLARYVADPTRQLGLDQLLQPSRQDLTSDVDTDASAPVSSSDREDSRSAIVRYLCV